MLHFPNPLLMFPPLLSFMASVDMGMHLHSANKHANVVNFVQKIGVNIYYVYNKIK